MCSKKTFVKFALLVTLLVVSLTTCHGGHVSSCDCGKNSLTISHLTANRDLLVNVNHTLNCPKKEIKALDCGELLSKGSYRSGAHVIWPKSRVLQDGMQLKVYCDMDTDGGGWTVIQRRGNYSRPYDYFYKDWASYKLGFGDIDKEFWLGNDNIFALTNQRLYSVRFDLQAFDGSQAYAVYDTFWIDDETHQYTLHIKDYRGNAGDSITAHDKLKFSTKDVDNDDLKNSSCAQTYKGAWWYGECHMSNLNGLYLERFHDSYANGVNWITWKGHHESLEITEIKIRPRNYSKIDLS